MSHLDPEPPVGKPGFTVPGGEVGPGGSRELTGESAGLALGHQMLSSLQKFTPRLGSDRLCPDPTF